MKKGTCEKACTKEN